MNQPFWNPFAPPQPPADPWQQGFEAWTRAFSQGAAPNANAFNPTAATNDAIERMTTSAKQFFDFLQAAQTATTSQSGFNPGAFANAAQMFTPGSNPMLDAMRGLNGQGAMSFEQLGAQSQAFAQQMQQEASSWLNVPTFGLTRASQQRSQQVVQAMAGLNEAQQKYQQQMLKATQLAFTKFESKLGERSEPGREVTSLRGVYDLWIDAAEEGYAEVALSKEYKDAYGELANAQLRVRKFVQEELERSAQSLGMPTRTELDAVHKKMADLRRRLAELEERLGERDAASAEHSSYAADKPQQSSKPANKRKK